MTKFLKTIANLILVLIIAFVFSFSCTSKSNENNFSYWNDDSKVVAELKSFVKKQ